MQLKEENLVMTNKTETLKVRLILDMGHDPGYWILDIGHGA